VIADLGASEVLERWRGWSSCRLCGCANGSTCKGDDAYNWPEGFAHYLKVHGVRPPDAFVAHCLGRLAEKTGHPGTRPPPPPVEGQ
jgi:hypothetical protein